MPLLVFFWRCGLAFGFSWNRLVFKGISANLSKTFPPAGVAEGSKLCLLGWLWMARGGSSAPLSSRLGAQGPQREAAKRKVRSWHVLVLPSLRERQSKRQSKQRCSWAVESSASCTAMPALTRSTGAELQLGSSPCLAQLAPSPLCGGLSAAANLAEVCFAALKRCKNWICFWLS